METAQTRYRSIFAPSTSEERKKNFESYWNFSMQHTGGLLEEDKDLINKRNKLKYFKDNPVRSRQPLRDPEVFYRNYVEMVDDPSTLDRKTLLLTCIYKFARHEWIGISGAWDVVPPMARSHSLTDKISRVHLAEEFCHIRLFHEMFNTFHLDRLEWVPLGRFHSWVYTVFPRLPESLMAAPAFVTELMGMTFYQQLDKLFDEILEDEPEAKERLRALLQEIMVDELAHIGQRRNYLGPVGVRFAKAIVRPLFTFFFRDIPETALLFDTEKMIQDGLSFDFHSVPKEILQRSWVPSYCQA